MELGAKESLNNKSSYDRWAAEARWHDRHLTSPERNATMRLAGRQQPGKPSPTLPKAARQAVTGRSRFSLTAPMGENAHPMRPQPPGVSRLHIQPMEYSVRSTVQGLSNSIITPVLGIIVTERLGIEVLQGSLPSLAGTKHPYRALGAGNPSPSSLTVRVTLLLYTTV